MENIITSVVLPRSLEQRLKSYAQKRGKTKSGLIQEALWDYLERRDIEPIERKLQAKARSMGIESDADVVHLIHEARKKIRR